MLYIVAALYAEAKPWIDLYELKRVNSQTRFQRFQNENSALIISGPGEMNAAIATTHLLSSIPPKEDSVILNMGICGAVQQTLPIGTAILCHQLIQHDTHKTFYPDTLFRHPFHEGSVETFSHPVKDEHKHTIRGNYVDMEGTGFYQAAAAFLPAHHIYILKIISDFLQFDHLTAEHVEHLISQHIPMTDEWLNQVQYMLRPEHIITHAEQQCLEQLQAHLKLSVTLQHELHRVAKQFKIATKSDHTAANQERDGDQSDNADSLAYILQAFMAEPVQNKQEGKIRFEQLKQKLIRT